MAHSLDYYSSQHSSFVVVDESSGVLWQVFFEVDRALESQFVLFFVI
jgi:hypothetical protein